MRLQMMHGLQIISSLDSATNGVVSEILAWTTSREATPIAQECLSLSASTFGVVGLSLI
jgi:hypothetical protein